MSDTIGNAPRARRPKPQLLPLIVRRREIMWEVLFRRAWMAGERITKASFARKYDLSDREFRRWFSYAEDPIQPGGMADARIRRAIKAERARIEAKLDRMTTPAT